MNLKQSFKKATFHFTLDNGLQYKVAWENVPKDSYRAMVYYRCDPMPQWKQLLITVSDQAPNFESSMQLVVKAVNEAG